jgi:polar amino acid transport system permease protein
MNWQFITDSLPLYEKAAVLTLKLAFWSILISSAIGLACSLDLYFKVKVVKEIVYFYTELSRNTPLLIQLFFLYYGLTKIGLRMSENTCAIVGLSFLGGSYMIEAFRGGLEAVGKPRLNQA